MIAAPKQLKRVVRRFAVGAGLRTAALARPRSAVILRYHSVRPDAAACSDPVFRGIVHTAAEFERHMELLAKKFSPVGIDAISRFLEGAETIPRRSVAVTFDDGYRDNYECAGPILQRYGIPAAFYATVSPMQEGGAIWFSRLRYAFDVADCRVWIDPASGREWPLSPSESRREAFRSASRRCAALTGQHQEQALRAVEESLGGHEFPSEGKLMMTWDQIRELESQGHVIGSHTMSHPNLAQIPHDQAVFELAESKRVLESCLGRPVRHFSYPHPIMDPHWNAFTAQSLRQLGYCTAVTCDHGVVGRGSDSLCLRRVSAPDDVERLEWLLETNLLGLRFR